MKASRLVTVPIAFIAALLLLLEFMWQATKTSLPRKHPVQEPAPNKLHPLLGVMRPPHIRGDNDPFDEHNF